MWEGKDTSKLFEGISLSQSQKPPFHLSVPRCLFPAYPCISPYLCLYLFSLSPFSFLPLSVSSVSFAVSFLIWKQKYCPRIPKTRFSTQRTSICPRRQMTGSKREKEGGRGHKGNTKGEKRGKQNLKREKTHLIVIQECHLDILRIFLLIYKSLKYYY